MDDAQIWDRLMAVVAGVQARGLSDEVATLAPLVDLAQEPRLRGELSRLLGFYFLRQQQHAQAVPHHQRAVALLPDRPTPPTTWSTACSAWAGLTRRRPRRSKRCRPMATTSAGATCWPPWPPPRAAPTRPGCTAPRRCG